MCEKGSRSSRGWKGYGTLCRPRLTAPFCVMGHGCQDCHSRHARMGTSGLQEVFAGARFPGIPASERGVGVITLVARAMHTRIRYATLVSSMVATGQFAAVRTNTFLKEIGAGHGAAIKAAEDHVAAVGPGFGRWRRREDPGGAAASSRGP